MNIKVRSLYAVLGYVVDTKGANKFNNIMRNMKRDIIGLTALWAGATASLGYFLNEAGKMEQVNVAFETMLGGVQMSKKLLADLFEFARVTPFRIPGVLSTTRILLGMGIKAEDMVETLTNLGNVAAGLSVPLEQIALSYGKVAAAGYLTGYELQNLRRAGVPLVKEISKILGVGREEVQSMVRKRKIDFDLFAQAFKNMSAQGGTFHNLMQRQAKTLFGVISNIQDGLQIIAIRIGEGILPQAKKLANQFLIFLDTYKEIIKLRAVKFLQEIGKWIYIITTNLGKNVRSAFKIIDSLIGVERALKMVLATLSAIVAMKLLGMIGAIGMAINNLANLALGANVKIALIPIAIGAAIALALLLFEDIYKWLKGGKGATVMEMLDKKFFGGKMRDNILKIWDDFKTFKKWMDAFVQDFYGWIGDIYNITVEYIGKIKPLLAALGEMVVGIVTLNPVKIKEGYDRFKNTLAEAADELKAKGIENVPGRAAGFLGGAADLTRAFGEATIFGQIVKYLAGSAGNASVGIENAMAFKPFPREEYLKTFHSDIYNGSPNNININVTANNADAKKIADEVKKELIGTVREDQDREKRNALRSGGAKGN